MAITDYQQNRLILWIIFHTAYLPNNQNNVNKYS
jgi:hypothetical protein